MSTRRKGKSSLPREVKDQLDQIIVPRVYVVFEPRDIDIVKRYRQAKEAMHQAIDTATINATADLLWLSEDTQAVEAADKTLRNCQIEMCALLDVAVLKAGVR